MASISYPGVYVQEMAAQPRAVAEPTADLAAFVGCSTSPAAPVQVGSLAEYEERFDGPAAGRLLHPSLRMFFANGGRRALVSAVGPQPAALRQGLQDLALLDGPALLLCPDAVNLAPADYALLVQAMLAQCAMRRDRFAILDIQRGEQPPRDLESQRALFGTDHLAFGAAYYPFVKEAGGTLLPPSGAVAGAYLANDRERGIWKAPANIALAGGLTPAVTLGNAEADRLNLDATAGRSINSLRNFSGKGLLIWGARTLAGNDAQWRYVPVRRFASLVETALNRGLAWAVFEPNDAGTWSRLRLEAGGYLYQQWRRGALLGSKPEQAFYVRCGLNETMTAADLRDGRLILEIGLAMQRPAEFIVLRLSWTTAA